MDHDREIHTVCSEKLLPAVKMTSGTATLNIFNVQKLAYSEARVQSQLEDIIRRILEVQARKVALFNKGKEDDAKSEKSDQE